MWSVLDRLYGIHWKLSASAPPDVGRGAQRSVFVEEMLE